MPSRSSKAHKQAETVIKKCISVDDQSATLAHIDEDLALLLDQSIVIDGSGEKPVRIERPFQYLFDHGKEIEEKEKDTNDKK